MAQRPDLLLHSTPPSGGKRAPHPAAALFTIQVEVGSSSPSGYEVVGFHSGNPSVEVTSGKLHLFRREESDVLDEAQLPVRAPSVSRSFLSAHPCG